MIKHFDVHETLLDFSQINPEKKAIIYNEQSVTYSEFKDMVISLTNKLKQLGVGKGDFVAVHMSNSIEMVLSIFAILNCNAVVIPINIDLSNKQIFHILTESNSKIILYNKNTSPQFTHEKAINYLVDYSELTKNNYSENDLIKHSPDDLAYCIFTSGSTGEPKGVLLTYKSIINHVKAKISLLGLTSEFRLCLSFNIGFVASIWQILTPVLLGAQLFIYDNDLIKKPYQFLEQLERNEVNVVSMIPHSLYGYCQYIGGKHQKLPLFNMKHIILTGEKVDNVVVVNFYKNYNHISLINAYGQSECSDDTFHHKISQNDTLDDIPIGKVIQGVSYHILNENLEEVIEGEKGELFIGGICLSRCYLNNDQLTKEKFVTVSDSTFFRTGDIVKLNESQDVICLGRADNQIKIRGHRVEPEEIETYLNQFGGINQSIVIPLETNEIDKILGAYYTSDTDINSKDIVDHLVVKLPAYMIPSAFKRVEKFILNANGKIDRNRILECVEIKADKYLPKISDFNKLTDIQTRAFEIIISNVNDKVSNNISLDMDFNSIGLDSITFIKTIVALESEFDFEFDDEMLLITKFPTIRSMVEYVESKTVKQIL